jgi:hypothetical protein
MCVCRPSSAEGGPAGSGSAEAAGLYWRKHRLMVPAGYAMTEADAHTAATATTSTESAQQHHADDSQTPAVQAVESAAAQEAVAEPVSNLDSPGYAGQAEASSSSACDILVIEDAAELTHDRAAAILKQLSYECQAAGKHGASSTYANQGATPPLQSLCQAAAASMPAHPDCADAAVSASVTQAPDFDLTTQQDSLSQLPEEEEEEDDDDDDDNDDGCKHAAQAANASLLHYALAFAADLHLQAQTLPTPNDAAASPASQQLPAQHLAVAARPQCVMSNEAMAVADSCHQQGQSQQPAAQAAVVSAPAAESPFLQRLRMSKQAGSTAPSSAVVQPSSMPGQHL